MIAQAQRGWERERNCDRIDHLQEAGDAMYKALELLLSPTPTGNEREAMVSVMLEHRFTALGQCSCGVALPRYGRFDAVNQSDVAGHMADVLSAAGFRVTPEPVYEYGWAGDAAAQCWYETCEEAEEFVRYPAEFRRVQAGPWLPVVSTSKEQDDE